LKLGGENQLNLLRLLKGVTGKMSQNQKPAVIMGEEARRGGELSTTVCDPNGKVARGWRIWWGSKTRPKYEKYWIDSG
jgi:hypothetical protein